MSRCQCEPPCQFVAVDLDEIKIDWDGAAKNRKAVAFPSHKLILIDRAYWDSIPTLEGRMAILAHERGHIEGARCEPCADFRAGEIMRREGVTTMRDGARHLTATLDNRDPNAARENFMAGYGIDDPFLLNRERAAGVKPPLVAFLDALARGGVVLNGKQYQVMVGIDGGVRTEAKQAELWAKGRARKHSDDSQWVIVNPSQVVTYARTAKETAHGRGDAIDIWVVENGKPLLYPKDSPRFEALYRALGAMGEARGLKWGGRFMRNGQPWPDWGHFEITSQAWLSLGALALLALAMGAWGAR